MPVFRSGDIIPMLYGHLSNGESWNRSGLRGKAALAIVALPESDAVAQAEYVYQFDSAARAWNHNQHALVISSTAVPTSTACTVLVDPEQQLRTQLFGDAPGGWMITDRYGAVYQQGTFDTLEAVPNPDDLHDWLEWVDMKCST